MNAREVPRAEGGVHGVERDEATAAGVDQHQAGPGQGQGPGVQQVRRLGRKGAVQGQAVALAQEVVERGARRKP